MQFVVRHFLTPCQVEAGEGSEAGQCAQPVVRQLRTMRQVEVGEGSEVG